MLRPHLLGDQFVYHAREIILDLHEFVLWQHDCADYLKSIVGGIINVNEMHEHS